MKLNKIHHIAVICSDYEKSKHFYTDVLGMKIMSENYRRERDSWKADCWLDDNYVIELFSFLTHQHVLPIRKLPDCAILLLR